MPLSSEKLIEKMDEKAEEILGDSYVKNREGMKDKLFKVLAESIIEYIKDNAAVDDGRIK